MHVYLYQCSSVQEEALLTLANSRITWHAT